MHVYVFIHFAIKIFFFCSVFSQYRRPTILLEHELTSVKFHPLGGSSKKISGSMKGQEGEGLFRDSYRDLDNYHRGLQTDEQFARNFLSGETCLLGVS